MTDAAAIERHRARVRARLRESGMTRPGPGSVSFKINREIVVVAGWGRAILLQLAHPLVAAGVADHSHFRASFTTRVGRLRSTVGAMRALTFGDDEDAIAAAARINAIHDRVLGATYSAHDPELLRWVHATLVDSILLAYERWVEPLSPEERDRYCTEAAVMEPLLDIPAGLLPRSRVELDAYLDEALSSGAIAVSTRARTLARAVLFPPGWRLIWPAIRPMQLVTIGMLPDAVRRAYGFTWSGREERALARWTAASTWLVRFTPVRLRRWPTASELSGATGGGARRSLASRAGRAVRALR